MPKVVMYKMGGREYPISQKFSGVDERWAEHLENTDIYQTFQQLDSMVEMIVQVVEGGMENLEAGPVISIARIGPAIASSLVRSSRTVRELVFDYVPEMKADAEWIAENVYSEEIWGAFLEILKIVFPFMGVWGLIRGGKAPGTPTNLPSTNGASGTKKNMARSKVR